MNSGVRKHSWRIMISASGPHPALGDLQRRTLEMETLDPPPADGDTILLMCDMWRGKNYNVNVKIVGRQRVLSYEAGSASTQWYELLHAIVVDIAKKTAP